MKKLIFSIALATIGFAAQAGSDKVSNDKGNSSCCGAATVSKQTKAECTMAKQSKASCLNAGKAAKETAAKRSLQSPKAFADAR